MNKIDPIIAVANLTESAAWYASVFDCKRTHGGPDFAVLEDENDQVLLCLHKWGEHGRPTMQISESPGNGLILYFKTDCINDIHQSVKKLGYTIEKEMQLNPNSGKKEFLLRDP